MISFGVDQRWTEEAEPTLEHFVGQKFPNEAQVEIIAVEDGAEHNLCIVRSSAAPTVGILVRGTLMDITELGNEPATYITFKSLERSKGMMTGPFGLVKSSPYFSPPLGEVRNGSSWNLYSQQACLVIGHEIVSACRRHGVTWLTSENGPEERVIEVMGVRIFPAHLLKTILARELGVNYDTNTEWFYWNVFPFLHSTVSTLLEHEI